jgi:hypothetical protein
MSEIARAWWVYKFLMPSPARRWDKSFLKRGNVFGDAQAGGLASNILWLTISPANPLKDFNRVIYSSRGIILLNSD